MNHDNNKDSLPCSSLPASFSKFIAMVTSSEPLDSKFIATQLDLLRNSSLNEYSVELNLLRFELDSRNNVIESKWSLVLCSFS